MTHFCAVDHASRVAEVRRTALAMAREEGLDATLSDNLALIVTEVCTNLLKHAQAGEVCLSPLSERNGAGVEVLAIDRGPGIFDVERCLTDGYSSAHTAGTGLGAVSRRARDFDVYSEPGKGTVLVAQVGTGSPAQTVIGAVVKPIKGEDVCGDAWACIERDGELTMMVADGLGHGVLAAEASAQAVAAFRLAADLSPGALLADVHQALRKTRGAAMAVAQRNQHNGEVKFAGIGNIGGVSFRIRQIAVHGFTCRNGGLWRPANSGFLVCASRGGAARHAL